MRRYNDFCLYFLRGTVAALLFAAMYLAASSLLAPAAGESVNAVKAGICVCSLFPVAYGFATYDKRTVKKLAEQECDGGGFSLKSSIASPAFYWQAGAFALFALIFSQMYLFLPRALFPGCGDTAATLLLLPALALPFAALLAFFRLRAARRIAAMLQSVEFELLLKRYSLKRMIASVVIWLANLAGLLLLIAVFALFGKPLSVFLPLLPFIAGGIVLAFLLGWLVNLLRGVKHRKRFVSQLSSACGGRGLSAEFADKPLSGLLSRRAVGVRLSDEKREYACAVVPCMKKRLPLVIDRGGRIFFLHKHEFRGQALFEWSSEIKTSAGDEEYLILNPAPATVLYRADDGTVGVVDNGMKAGRYTVYTGGALCRAIERSIFGKER